LSIIPFNNPSGHKCGIFDTKDLVYASIRDGRKHLFFKFNNGIAISESILKRLKELNCITLRITITNFEVGPFDAVITFKGFMDNSKEVFYRGQKLSDKQRVLPMKNWNRVYSNQRRLI